MLPLPQATHRTSRWELLLDDLPGLRSLVARLRKSRHAVEKEMLEKVRHEAEQRHEATAVRACWSSEGAQVFR